MRDYTSRHNRLRLYFTRHVQSCVYSLQQLIYVPFASLMTLTVLGVALALPAGLFVLLQNAQAVSHGWNDSAQISLYLKDSAGQDQAQTLVSTLRAKPTIAQVQYISPEEGLAEFKEQSDMGAALNELDENPLPGVIVVQPALSSQSPDEMNSLLQELQQLPGVDIAQLDMQWVKRLYSLIQLGKRAVVALATLLGLGVLLVIGNTIRLATENHHKEIAVMKLVGATDAFVRRPFLYTGILYGTLGAVVAWILVTIALWWLSSPVSQLAELYGSGISLSGLSLGSVFFLLLMGGFLGLVGAWLAVARHLRMY